jgi:hypothetical protein
MDPSFQPPIATKALNLGLFFFSSLKRLNPPVIKTGWYWKVTINKVNL